MTAADHVRPPSDSRLLYSVTEAAALLGVGRTYLFRLIAAGEIESIKVGKLRKIPRDALGDYIDKQRAEQTTNKPRAGRPVRGQPDP